MNLLSILKIRFFFYKIAHVFIIKDYNTIPQLQHTLVSKPDWTKKDKFDLFGVAKSNYCKILSSRTFIYDINSLLILSAGHLIESTL